jgi:aspartyl-tRNA(Asn)/glutamyl-tRNA(Gln) amidotransferase subunit A
VGEELVDPSMMTAGALVDLFRRRELSPVEALSAIEKRIDHFGSTVNAFVARNPEAMTAAKASEARWFAGRPQGVLDGIPCTVKDVMDLTGFPTRSGSNLTSDESVTSDAPAVVGLKTAGAIVLGKTTTTEFGWKAPGDCPQSGVTRNPWDLSRTPGGSSSGAGAAGAACFGPLHIGTDAGGSIRVPAAWCGLVGLKPTHGRVPQWPVGAFAHVACAGPMSRSVYDAALMLSAMARPDLRDPYCLPDVQRNWCDEIDKGIAGLRIAVMANAREHVSVDTSSVAALTEASDVLAKAGALVRAIELPLFELQGSFDRQWGLALARLVALYSPIDRASLDPALLRLADANRAMSAVEFLEAEIQGSRFAHEMGVFHQQYDLFICPSVPTPPPFSDLVLADEVEAQWTRWGAWTFAFNISQQPAISVPFGLDPAGLPRSVQIVAAKHRDDLVLRAAQILEREQQPAIPDLARNTASWQALHDGGLRSLRRFP